MTTPANPATLASWRRTVAEHYAHVRATSGVGPAAAAATFRAARESLFREHPDSPIPAELRRALSLRHDQGRRPRRRRDRDRARLQLRLLPFMRIRRPLVMPAVASGEQAAVRR